MMTRTTLIFIWISLLSFTGCVSVNLGTPDANKRAVGVDIKTPGKPFVKEERTDVDGAWKNEKNGNVISYLSDCKDPSDPPLDNIIQGVLTGLADLSYDNKESVMVQGREGRRVAASGKVDGVPSQIDLLVFKRNHCIYILSYVGVKSAFASDRGHFNNFVDGFRAP